MAESWRTEAYCRKHSRQERIVSVRSAEQLSLSHMIYHADVILKCGASLMVATSAKNLQEMEV